MGGGAVLGPGRSNWDMSLAKLFTVHKGQTLQYRWEFFSTFNHSQFANQGVNAALLTFWQIIGTSMSPRVIQLALNLSF